MPFQSKKQEAFMFSQHPDIAKRWAAVTPNQSKLPTYAHLDKFFDGGVVGKEHEDGKETEPVVVMGSGHHEPKGYAHGGEVSSGEERLDSPKNDTVMIKASPEEIVLPRSVTLAKDAPEKAKEFVLLHKFLGEI